MTHYSAQETAYIFMLDGIDARPAEQLIKKIVQDLNKEVKHLYFLICTNGGSVSHGIALYNFLMSLPYDITMHNISNVDSIGNVVFLAGKQRYATANATFLLHPVKSELSSRQIDINQAKEKASSIDADDKRIKGIFFQRTSIPNKDMNRLFKAGEDKTADYALEIGMIHEIREMNIDFASQIIVIGSDPSPEGNKAKP